MIGKLTRFRSMLAAVALVLSALPLLAGCGSGDPTAAPAPTPTVAVQSLQVSLATDPSPAKAGPVTFIVEVKDDQNRPVEGAKVSLSANHPSMMHSGIAGDMAEQGGGRYQASGSLSMGGTWRVEITATKQRLPSKTQAFDLPVQ